MGSILAAQLFLLKWFNNICKQVDMKPPENKFKEKSSSKQIPRLYRSPIIYQQLWSPTGLKDKKPQFWN